MNAAPQIRGSAPILLVADVVKAADYYAQKRGFVTARMWGEPPAFAIPGRDGFEVMLNRVAKGDAFWPNASYEGRLDAYFYVSDADARHAEFAAKGANIVCPPSDEPYMKREFQVRDLDGRWLASARDISGQA